MILQMFSTSFVFLQLVLKANWGAGIFFVLF